MRDFFYSAVGTQAEISSGSNPRTIRVAVYFQPHCGPYLMKTKITQAELKEMLRYDPETGAFTWRVSYRRAREGAVAGAMDGSGYVRIKINGTPYKAHRLAWFYMTGVWPEGDMDHRNRIRSDNRWNNLRQATRGENNWNTPIRADNKSGIKGVCWDPRSRRWRTSLWIGGKQRCLGLFSTLGEASQVVRAAREKHHGPFANHG